MSQISKNTTPITFNEFKERTKKKVHRIKGYYSLFIARNGEIFDCGYPEALCHNGFCVNVYENLDDLPEKTFNSCLRGLKIPFDEISYYIMDYHNLLDVMYVDSHLYTTIDKVLLSSEDKVCQDLGFVKVAINENLKTFEVVVPNSLFGKKVTASQKETIEQLSELFNIDLDVKLKGEQKSNAELATQINSALNTVKKA